MYFKSVAQPIKPQIADGVHDDESGFPTYLHVAVENRLEVFLRHTRD